MKALLNVKVDLQTKKEAQKLAKEMGLSLSAVVNANLQQFLNVRHIYFSAPNKMSKKLEKTLEPIEADIKADRNMSPVFDSADAMIEHLRQN